MLPRIIPTLLLKKTGLVKGIAFQNHKYIGDPINAVRIFSEKEVDELFFLDITAAFEKRSPSVELVRHIAEECYMPFCVGGGISTVKHVHELLYAGAEKVCVNTHALENPDFIPEIAGQFGSQSLVVSIDVKKKSGVYSVYSHCGTRQTRWTANEWAKEVEQRGAGEILLTSIEQEGSMQGYDVDLLRRISDAVQIPVIAGGGAGTLAHFKQAIELGHASAVSAGSLFVFYKSRNAVLIHFPSRQEIEKTLGVS